MPALTNFVALGDALSGAILRLFKWERESSQHPREDKCNVSMRGSCFKLVHLNGSNMLVLDVSFHDDLRMFFFAGWNIKHW